VARGSQYPQKAKDVMFNPVGQTVGLMHSVRKAKDVVNSLVEEYVDACERIDRINEGATTF
jgi:hypothetical protein